MRNVSFTLCLIALSAGPLATAATKICFGSTRNDDTRGAVMTAKITREAVTLKTIKEGASFAYNGTYSSYGSSVEGRDGHTYLEYKGENSDYQDVIMVDQRLLKKSTKGLLQIRARGEGFFNYAFVCKDRDSE